jgi:hypothetical protein
MHSSLPPASSSGGLRPLRPAAIPPLGNPGTSECNCEGNQSVVCGRSRPVHTITPPWARCPAMNGRAAMTGDVRLTDVTKARAMRSRLRPGRSERSTRDTGRRGGPGVTPSEVDRPSRGAARQVDSLAQGMLPFSRRPVGGNVVALLADPLAECPAHGCGEGRRMKEPGERGRGLPPAELQPPQADSRAQRDAQVPVLRGLA